LWIAFVTMKKSSAPWMIRHSAAERGRRDVHDALPLQRFREARDLVHQPAGNERRVVGE
jgi:hypothetical protein